MIDIIIKTSVDIFLYNNSMICLILYTFSFILSRKEVLTYIGSLVDSIDLRKICVSVNFVLVNVFFFIEIMPINLIQSVYL